MFQRFAITVAVFGAAATIAGCAGGGSSHPSHPASGTVQGRVFTVDCGGPARASCAPTNYRGELAFCRKMNVIGPCPTARVDATGHYRIRLRPAGRWAVIPAPGSGNVV
jgi:hypothetical protein